jgi:hypothetical protein
VADHRASNEFDETTGAAPASDAGAAAGAATSAAAGAGRVAATGGVADLVS